MNQEPFIHVGIMALPQIQFELKGSFIFDSEKIESGKHSVCFKGGTLKSDFAEDCSCIKIVPQNDKSSFVLKNVKIGIGFHWEQFENQEFEGNLVFIIEKETVRAINEIKLEDYLRSVISSEMSAMNDSNLLAAHAIVSRSWLLAQIQNRNHSKEKSFTQTDTEITKWYDREDHDLFDVCADDHCQRYQGITKIISSNAKKAIEETRGKVLIYDGEICDARFSKCCGGISEDFRNVWQPRHIPYLSAIRDSKALDSNSNEIGQESFILSNPKSFCNTSDPEILKQVLVDFDQATTNFYRWNVCYQQKELAMLIEKKSGIHFGKILDLVPLERGKSGRIIRLLIKGTERELIVGKELEIRKWLSESHLYSSAFVVEKIYKNEDRTIPASFKLHGAGWGHGVGMCQIGAAVMSKKGYTFQQILEHYFQQAHINQLYQ